MDLLHHIRGERQQRSRKEPLERTLFTRISGLVKHFGLDMSFLEELDNTADRTTRKKVKFDQVRHKEHFEFPLFSLVTEEEYRVTTAIICKVDNPYLHFAHSAAEILLSVPLFHLNPDLSPAKLATYHFETLMLLELARKEVEELTGQLAAERAGGERGRDAARETSTEASLNEDESRQNSLQERIEHLRTFIGRVENP
jgi:hypothetical protein